MLIAWRVILEEDKSLPLLLQSCNLIGIVLPLLAALVESYKRHRLYAGPGGMAIPTGFIPTGIVATTVLLAISIATTLAKSTLVT